MDGRQIKENRERLDTMPQDPIERLSTERLAKQLSDSDIIRNRVTLAITILNHLRDGENVDKLSLAQVLWTDSPPGPRRFRRPERVPGALVL